MAGQGCPNEGLDRRLFGKLTCFLQRLGTFRSRIHPVLVMLEFPLGLRVFIPWRGGKTLMIRTALWRYDWNAREYIGFSGAVKKMERPYPLYL